MGAGRLAAFALGPGHRPRQRGTQAERSHPAPGPMEDGGQSPPKPCRAVLVSGSVDQLDPSGRPAPPLDRPARGIRGCPYGHPGSRRPLPQAMGNLEAKPPARSSTRCLCRPVADFPCPHHAGPPGLAHGGCCGTHPRATLPHETEPPGVGAGRSGGRESRPRAPSLLLATSLGSGPCRRSRHPLRLPQAGGVDGGRAIRSPLGARTLPGVAHERPGQDRELTDSLPRGDAIPAPHRPQDLALLRNVRRRGGACPSSGQFSGGP